MPSGGRADSAPDAASRPSTATRVAARALYSKTLADRRSERRPPPTGSTPAAARGGKGDTDLFVVAPEETIEHVKGWLRLWVAIPNAVAGIEPLKRDLLIVIDEMPRIGFLKPVMDGYTMAAGKGVHFWCFAQSISALNSSWGKEHRKTLLHLAELVQVLGFPRTDAEGAEELSRAIGTATFEGRTESKSGTIAESRIVSANTQWQAGESRSLVRERLVTPDELMTLGPDRQYVIAAAKDMPRDALYLHHAPYWRRPDARWLADPNPFVLRKKQAERRRERKGRRVSARTQGVLQEAREFVDSSGLVFPSPRGGAISANTISKLLRQLDIDAVPHGFRSSFRDWAAECSDAPREVCELALAHVNSNRVEAAYRRTDLFEQRRVLMEQWSGFVGRSAESGEDQTQQ